MPCARSLRCDAVQRRAAQPLAGQCGCPPRLGGQRGRQTGGSSPGHDERGSVGACPGWTGVSTVFHGKAPGPARRGKAADRWRGARGRALPPSAIARVSDGRIAT